METYLIIEGINEHGERKQVLVNKDTYKRNNLQPGDYFCDVDSFKRKPAVIGEVEMTGNTDFLVYTYVSD